MDNINFVTLEEFLRRLMPGPHATSLTLDFNDDFAADYLTAEQWENRKRASYNSDDWSADEWVSPEEHAKSLQKNSVWTLTWCPNGQVSHYTLRASSLSALFTGLAWEIANKRVPFGGPKEEP